MQLIANITGVFECQPNNLHVSPQGLSGCSEMAITVAVTIPHMALAAIILAV